MFLLEETKVFSSLGSAFTHHSLGFYRFHERDRGCFAIFRRVETVCFFENIPVNVIQKDYYFLSYKAITDHYYDQFLAILSI